VWFCLHGNPGLAAGLRGAAADDLARPTMVGITIDQLHGLGDLAATVLEPGAGFQGHLDCGLRSLWLAVLVVNVMRKARVMRHLG